LGTYFSVMYYSAEEDVKKEQIDSLLQCFSNSMSYNIDSSVISKINRNETNIMDDHFKIILKRSKEIYHKTDGAFDVTVCPLVNAWGFGSKEKESYEKENIEELLQYVGLDKVSIESGKVIKEVPELQFDFNAIAKGYASDLIAAMLESKGIYSYLVDIGGDMVVGNRKPDGSYWRIAVERPAKEFDAPQEFDHIIEVENRAIATSGNYRRYFEKDGERYSHIISPFTGYPVENNLVSVTVFADDCMTADAYATAFLVMGKEESLTFLEDRSDLDAVFIFLNEDDEFEILNTGKIELEDV